MIVTTGLHAVVGLVGDTDTPVDFTYIAYGSGTGAVVAGDEALGTETQRAVATMKIKSIVNHHDTISYTHYFTTPDLGTATEVGIFTSNAAGTMLLRKLLIPATSYPKGAILMVSAEVTVKNNIYGTGADW